MILGFILYTLFLVIAFCVFLLYKNAKTYKNTIKITNAIHAYHKFMISARNYDYKVDYDDMEDYDSTLWRLWDFGHKNILPKEKFRAIGPFMEG